MTWIKRNESLKKIHILTQDLRLESALFFWRRQLEQQEVRFPNIFHEK